MSKTVRSGGAAAGASGAGRDAESPWKMPLAAWKQVASRTWQESTKDNVGLIAAGVAFYGFLALVPLLGAIVLSYGLLAEPETVIQNMQSLTSVMPADAARLVGEQLMNVVQTSGEKKGFGLLLALLFALFGARNGAGAIITALNIAYEEEEKRGFIRVNLLALVMTFAAVMVAILALVAVTALGYLHKLVPGAPAFLIFLGKIVSYVLLVLAGAAAAATLYRFGPSRQKARWAWLTPGSIVAAVLWVVLTLGFGIYVANFGNYDATYGSLGAVVVLLTWMYLSSYILLFGAELNSELEHQTAKDTTAGRPNPIGARGAWVADHVAGGAEPSEASEQAAPQLQPAPAVHRASPEQPVSPARDYAASRATAKAGRVVGLKKVGVLSSALSTMGLAMMRRKGKARQGAMLLATAAGFAWLTRSDK